MNLLALESLAESIAEGSFYSSSYPFHSSVTLFFRYQPKLPFLTCTHQKFSHEGIAHRAIHIWNPYRLFAGKSVRNCQRYSWSVDRRSKCFFTGHLRWCELSGGWSL